MYTRCGLSCRSRRKPELRAARKARSSGSLPGAQRKGRRRSAALCLRLVIVSVVKEPADLSCGKAAPLSIRSMVLSMADVEFEGAGVNFGFEIHWIRIEIQWIRERNPVDSGQNRSFRNPNPVDSTLESSGFAVQSQCFWSGTSGFEVGDECFLDRIQWIRSLGRAIIKSKRWI